MVEDKLIDAIRKCSSLTASASGSGVHVHLLPEKPSDVEDEGDFHYVILGPKGASRPGSPSSEARRFLTEKSGPDAPRVYRNAVVLAVPSVEGLEAVRNAIRDNQGWLQVESQLKGQDIDNNRKQLLELEKKNTQARAAELVKQAYTIVVTVSDKNDIQAFKVVLRDNTPLFNVIKADSQSRILEGAVTAEALLPSGPYNLWHEGETRVPGQRYGESLCPVLSLTKDAQPQSHRRNPAQWLSKRIICPTLNTCRPFVQNVLV